MSGATASVHIGDEHRGYRAAIDAARGRLALVALLVALAALAWWSTVDRMSGMDDGPGTDLGAFGWFVGVWVVMMAAMMLPSVAPTVALYARMARTATPAGPLVFATGYLVAWAGAGVAAYALFELVSDVAGASLAWDDGGRWVAGGALVVAAAYEVTPLKHRCLAHCRSPLGFMVGSWRNGIDGALRMGVAHGGWCIACCWALMAALFALGVMSLAWMALVAGLIAAQKLLPSRRVTTYASALLLLALGVAVLAAPDSVPWLTIPGSMGGGMGGGMMG